MPEPRTPRFRSSVRRPGQSNARGAAASADGSRVKGGWEARVCRREGAFPRAAARGAPGVSGAAANTKPAHDTTADSDLDGGVITAPRFRAAHCPNYPRCHGFRCGSEPAYP